MPGHNEIINHVEWRQILGPGLAKTQRFVQVEEAGIAQCIVFDRQLTEDTVEHAQSLLDGLPKGVTTIARDWIDCMETTPFTGVDYLFKRSLVHRTSGEIKTFPCPTLPLFYAVKYDFAEAMSRARASLDKNIDVSCFF